MLQNTQGAVVSALLIASASAGPNDYGVTSHRFVENLGQWATPARFVARFPGAIVRAEENGVLIQLFEGDPRRGVLLRMEFGGTAGTAELLGEDEGPGRQHFYRGNDPARWKTGARMYSRVRWHDLAPGVDFILGVSNAGALKYDIEVAPRASIAGLEIQCAGHESLCVDPNGSLIIRTSLDEMQQALGPAWEIDSAGNSKPTEWRFELTSADTFGIDVPGRRRDHQLVIDPELTWSTYLGSSTNPFGSGDFVWASDTGPGGDVYLAGEASGLDFPVTPGAYQQQSLVGEDVFVARIKGSDGALVYSALIGGEAWQDRPLDLEVDAAGAVYVVGTTDSDDFPTTAGAFDRTHGGTFFEGFVFGLSPDGSDLRFSTFLGGFANDDVETISLDSNGSLVVGGVTGSVNDFPLTPGAWISDFEEDGASFVTKLDSTGSRLIWSTLVGRTSGDLDLEVGSEDNVIIVGRTAGPFPTTPGAWSPPTGSLVDVFACQLDADGSQLLWSTVFGGTLDETPFAMCLDAFGCVLIGGWTRSTDFPTTRDSWQPSYGGAGGSNFESFVVRLAPDGSEPIYSTYIGSGPDPGSTRLVDLTADASGQATIVGDARLTYPITPGAFLETAPGLADLFVTRLDPLGERYLYSTFLGGPFSDRVQVVTQGPARRVTVGGYTPGGWPVTPNAIDPTFNGGQFDVFAASFDLLPRGVEQRGESTPGGCLGLLAASVTEMPVADSSTFAITCSGAPPASTGWLVLGPSKSSTTGPSGTNAWSESVRPWQRIPVRSDQDGWIEAPLHLPVGSTGSTFEARFFVRGSPSCPSPSWNASQVLVLTVQ